MEVNTASLKALNTATKQVFNEELATVEPTTEHTKIATVVEAKESSVNYGWIGSIPKMRKWVGKRTLSKLKMGKYTIDKEKFESTIEIPLDFVRSDTIGLAKPIIKDFAKECASHYDEIVFPMLEANKACYDGIKFFSDIHPIKGDIKASNIGKAALSQEAVLAARQQMRKITNPEGKPLRIKPNLLVVPSELEGTALNIVKAQLINGGNTNITYGMLEVLVVDDLTDDKSWYLLDTTRALKPLILQKNTAITFTAMANPYDEAVFMDDVARYGAMSEDNAGYGLWQLAYKSDGTA